MLRSKAIVATFAAALLLISCSSLAPDLVGPPEETGMLAIQGEVVKSGLFTGGAIFSKNVNALGSAEIQSSDNQIIKGDPYISYMIFSNLKPGTYKLVRVGTNPWFGANMDLPDGELFSFKIEAGKPKYVGFLKIGSFDIGLPGGWVLPGKQNIGIRYKIEEEIEAWEYLADLYADTQWAPRMKARVAEVRQESSRSVALAPAKPARAPDAAPKVPTSPAAVPAAPAAPTLPPAPASSAPAGRTVAFLPAKLLGSGVGYRFKPLEESQRDAVAIMLAILDEKGYQLKRSYYDHNSERVKAAHAAFQAPQELLDGIWSQSSVFSNPHLNRLVAQQAGASMGVDVVITDLISASDNQASYTLYWVDVHSGKMRSIGGDSDIQAVDKNIAKSLAQLMERQD